MIDTLAEIPHSSDTNLDAVVQGERLRPSNFTHVGRSGQLWFMPQWELLDALAAAGRRYPSVTLLMDDTSKSAISNGDRVTGVQAEDPDGELTVYADLVMAADDGRSRLRTSAGLTVQHTSVPVDVLWFCVSRPAAYVNVSRVEVFYMGA